MQRRTPILSPCFAALTLLTSLSVAYFTRGQPFATVSEKILLHSGFAVDVKTLSNGEIWRLLTCQLVHVRQLHMLFNVLLCWILGNSLERSLGRMQFALIYWIGGTLGILTIVLALHSVGSGASQALMALCSSAIVMNVLDQSRLPKRTVGLALTATTIQLGLDLYTVHYPKPGHVVSFIAGCLFMLRFRYMS